LLLLLAAAADVHQLAAAPSSSSSSPHLPSLAAAAANMHAARFMHAGWATRFFESARPLKTWWAMHASCCWCVCARGVRTIKNAGSI
jgi:hypothetical protein